MPDPERVTHTDLRPGDVIVSDRDPEPVEARRQWRVVWPRRDEPVRRRPLRSDSRLYVVPHGRGDGTELPTPWPWATALRLELGARPAALPRS